MLTRVMQMPDSRSPQGLLSRQRHASGVAEASTTTLCFLACVAIAVSAGCDQSKTTASHGAGATTTTAPAERPQSTIAMATTIPVDGSVLQPLTNAASDPLSSPRTRVPLIAIPLTAELPSTWGVQQGAGGKTVIAQTSGAPLEAGRPPSDEVEILLGKRADMKPEALELLIKDMQQATSRPLDVDGNPTTTRIAQRDGMRIIEETQRVGPANADANLVPYRWTVQYVVPSDGLDFKVYELNVTGISEARFKTDESFLRTIFDSVKPDPAALAAATRPVRP